jgi:hypothetical protein
MHRIITLTGFLSGATFFTAVTEISVHAAPPLVNDLQGQVLVLQGQVASLQNQINNLLAQTQGYTGSITAIGLAPATEPIDRIHFDLLTTNPFTIPPTVTNPRNQESFTAALPDPHPLNQVNSNLHKYVEVKTHNDGRLFYLKGEANPMEAVFSFNRGVVTGTLNGIPVSGIQLLTPIQGNISVASLLAVPAINLSGTTAEEVANFLGTSKSPVVSQAAESTSSIVFSFTGIDVYGIAVQAGGQLGMWIQSIEGHRFRITHYGGGAVRG